MPRRVVIGVGIADYPFHSAGNTWAFLQWVLGFRAAGWDMRVDIPLMNTYTIATHGHVD